MNRHHGESYQVKDKLNKNLLSVNDFEKLISEALELRKAGEARRQGMSRLHLRAETVISWSRPLSIERNGELLTHKKQARTIKNCFRNCFRHSQASSITLVRLSILKIRSTSRTLCLLFAKILHRKTLAISLNASYEQKSGLVPREQPPGGEMSTYKEIQAQS